MTKINCAVCGKEIINPNSRQKTCSRKCAKIYRREYHKTDTYKASQIEYQKTDKFKAHKKAYRKAYYQRSEVKARRKAYYQRNKNKEK